MKTDGERRWVGMEGRGEGGRERKKEREIINYFSSMLKLACSKTVIDIRLTALYCYKDGLVI